MSDDNWVTAAMADNSVVADLLLRLHEGAAPIKAEYCSPSLPFEWLVRKRRSNPTVKSNKKPAPTVSPDTPLSWSGGTTTELGGGGVAADGFEESSRPPDSARSKVTVAGGTTTTKRSRKKKTLAELKEEEIWLTKERMHLKKELASMLITLEKQRATNESLKRLKLDVEASGVEAAASVGTTSDQNLQKLVSSDPTPILPLESGIDDCDALAQLFLPNGSCKRQLEARIRENKFQLPDLNLPFEDDSKFRILCGSKS